MIPVTGCTKFRYNGFGFQIDFFFCIFSQFDNQNRSRFTLKEKPVFTLRYICFGLFENNMIHKLYGNRSVRQCNNIAFKGFVECIAVNTNQCFFLRRKRNQVQLDFSNKT